MRYVIICIILLSSTSSCNLNKVSSDTETMKTFHADDENDKQVKKINGEWLIVNVKVEASDRQTELMVENELDTYRGDMELNPIEFKENGKMIIGPTSHTTQLEVLNWTFLPPNFIAMNKDGNESFYEIMSLDADTMILFTELPVAGKSKGKVTVINKLYRIDGKKFGGQPIFSDSINWWRVHPKRSETHSEIAKRLKAMLDFNYVYIRSLYYSEATFINTTKFNMPFMYYNGAIGLKNELDAHDRFMDYFYTKENMMDALQMLREAFPKVEYKKKANYVLEYADFMKDLGSAIE